MFSEGRSEGYVYRWGQYKRFAEIKNTRYEVTDGKWHHLCGITDEKGNITLWVNGVKAGPRAGELIIAEPVVGATLGSVAIAKGDNVRRTHTSKPFNGSIDEFMIFDRALKDLEVSELCARYKPFARD